MKNKKRWVTVGVSVALALAGVTLPPEQVLILQNVVGVLVGA